MESKELFYILLIIILFLNLLNKKEKFLNLRKDKKKNTSKCCKGKCIGKPKYLTGKKCDENKNNAKNNLVKQYDSNFKDLTDFYNKRPKFESHYGKLVEKPERDNKLKKALDKKDYVPAFNNTNTIANNSGKPGFYINGSLRNKNF